MSSSASSLLFKNARVFDGVNADCADGQWLRVADGVIQEISSQPLNAGDATRVIDVASRTLMPGLIDAHVHAFASAAEMMLMGDQIGCQKVGACADLLVVDGDPLADIGLLAASGRHLRTIVRGGELIRNAS
jgi:imidazolonepropionase-like amidohydrolase